MTLLKLVAYVMGSVLMYFIVHFFVGLVASASVANVAGWIAAVLGFIYAVVVPDEVDQQIRNRR